MLKIDIKEHKPLRDLVYEEMRIQIMNGKIRPGTRLMEVELAEEIGVSRTPVREAIRKLEKEGLVVIEQRRGAYVSKISEKEMYEILEVRQQMEGMAAYLAASRMNREQLDKLKKAELNYSRAVAQEDTLSMIKFDSLFHKTILEGSNNNTLIRLVEPLQEMALRFRYLYYNDASRALNVPQEHEQIISAIENGSAEEARQATYHHIKNLKEHTQVAFEKL